MKNLLIIPMFFACYMGMCQAQASVIGKPIRLQNFEVAQYDFEAEMNWDDAKLACAKLGKGWRLPTKNELNVMYKNKDRIGGFAGNRYWSSTEVGSGNAWNQYFDDGFQSLNEESSIFYVRAVRAF